VGGYSDYLENITAQVRQEKVEATTDQKSSIEKEDKESSSTFINRNLSKQRKLKFTYREEQEYREIEDVITDLEEQLSVLENTIQMEVTNYVKLQELIAEKEKLEKTLTLKMERWVYLNDLAEKIAESK
jgi:ATP-binding cassette subfamily F protein uup